MEYVVLVDEQDNAIGTMEKQQAHVEGVLHRAFSFSILKTNYFFRSALLRNTIVGVCGQTLAVPTLEKKKTF